MDPLLGDVRFSAATKKISVSSPVFIYAILYEYNIECPAHSTGTTAQTEADALTQAADILSHAYHSVNYWFSITTNVNGIILKSLVAAQVKENSLLPLSDLVELLWVTDDDLNSHLHLGLLQAEVQASNLGVGNTLYHAFWINTGTACLKQFKIDYPGQLYRQNNKDIKTCHFTLGCYSHVWLEKTCHSLQATVSVFLQSQCTFSHAYHCLRHKMRHSSKFKWEFNQLKK